MSKFTKSSGIFSLLLKIGNIKSLIIIYCIFLLVFFTTISSGLKHTKDHFVYTVDDAYIHMSIAKNFSQFHNWGITRHKFTSSSSSIIWTLFLSLLFKIFCVKDIIPLTVNLCLSILLIGFVYSKTKQINIPEYLVFIFLFILFFLTPIISLIFTGLEHILQIILVISFISGFQLIGKPSKNQNPALFLIASFLLPLVRFESLFLIGWTFVILIFLKNFRTAISMLIASIIPVFAYGLYSKSRGWFFFPNSIVLKGQGKNLLHSTYYKQIPKILWFNLIHNPHVAFLIFSAGILIIYHYISKKTFNFDGLLFILVALSHLTFAKTSTYHFFRYEAYLIFWGIYLTLIWSFNLLRQNSSLYSAIPIITSIILIFCSCINLKFGLIKKVPKGMENIYSQQFQIARFLKRYYEDKPVLVNDIGLTSYLGRIKTVDLFGLSDLDVAKAMLNREYDPLFIYKMCLRKKVKIGVFYEHWMAMLGGVPSPWIHIATLSIKDNVVCGGDRVEFFAIDKTECHRLFSALTEFKRELPATSFLTLYTNSILL